MICPIIITNRYSHVISLFLKFRVTTRPARNILAKVLLKKHRFCVIMCSSARCQIMNRARKLKIESFRLNFGRSSGVFMRVTVSLKVCLDIILLKKRVEVAEKLVVPDSASFEDLVMAGGEKIVEIVGVF